MQNGERRDRLPLAISPIRAPSEHYLHGTSSRNNVVLALPVTSCLPSAANAKLSKLLVPPTGGGKSQRRTSSPSGRLHTLTVPSPSQVANRLPSGLTMTPRILLACPLIVLRTSRLAMSAILMSPCSLVTMIVLLSGVTARSATDTFSS